MFDRAPDPVVWRLWKWQLVDACGCWLLLEKRTGKILWSRGSKWTILAIKHRLDDLHAMPWGNRAVRPAFVPSRAGYQVRHARHQSRFHPKEAAFARAPRRGR